VLGDGALRGARVPAESLSAPRVGPVGAQAHSCAVHCLPHARIAEGFHLAHALGAIGRLEVDSGGRMTTHLGDADGQALDLADQGLDGNRLGDRRALPVLAIERSAVRDARRRLPDGHTEATGGGQDRAAHWLVAVNVLVRVDVGRLAADELAEELELAIELLYHRLSMLLGDHFVRRLPRPVAEHPLAEVEVEAGAERFAAPGIFPSLGRIRPAHHQRRAGHDPLIVAADHPLVDRTRAAEVVGVHDQHAVGHRSPEAHNVRETLWVLGINGPPIGWHDAAACLVDGQGNVVAMAEEERFTRVKHAVQSYPKNAARFCLDFAGIEPGDLDVIAVGWDLPRLYPRFGGDWGFTAPRDFIARALDWSFPPRTGPELICVPHHRAHAISAFYASGFEEAAILVNDGNGEDEAISIYEARFGLPIVRREDWPRSHSLGFMYDAACRAIGLTFLEAGKTMGLAPYGKAREPWKLMEGEGTEFQPPFALGPEADYDEIIPAWTAHLRRHGEIPVSTASADLDKDELAVQVAWSAQATVERLVPALVAHARALTGIDAVCLAGGVALNCSTNGLLQDPLYVPPVSADAGGALGAAWDVAPPSAPLAPLDPYLGLEPETPASLADHWVPAELDPAAVVDRLLRDRIGAIARGRAEVGPRALGHRSLIALPRDAAMRDRLNTLKGRELWRPLAPIGTADAADRLWRGPRELQRYMLGAATVTPEGSERIAATVHVDGTARAQVADGAGLISDVLAELVNAGADPVLINTSFNTRGEPIVNTAEDAVNSAELLGVDFLVVGDALFDRR